MKTCKVCGVEKQDSEFFSGSKDGKSWIYGKCKACCMAAQREYRAAQALPVELRPVKVSAGPILSRVCKECGTEKLAAEYRHSKRDEKSWPVRTCLDCEAAKNQARREMLPERRARHREKEREAAKRRYHENLEETRAKQRAWYAANREKQYEKGKRYSRKNREKLTDLHREYMKKNPERESMYGVIGKARSKAILFGRTSHFSADEWIVVCEKYGNRCLRCNKEGVLSPDHVLPFTCGGSNTIDNIQPLCKKCNVTKNNMHIDYRPESEYRGIELSVRISQ